MDHIEQTIEATATDHVTLTADLVSAYVSNNNVPASDLPTLIATMHAALSGLGSAAGASAPEVEKLTPAQIRKSITHEHLVSFEDGRPYKTLRRHLTLRGLTAEAYKAKWGLPKDYPMTAASYSAQRSELAKDFGLGQQRRKAAAPPPASEPAPAAEKPRRAARPRKAKEPAEA